MNNHKATDIIEILQAGYEGVCFLEDRINHGRLSLFNLDVLDTMVELLSVLENFASEMTIPNRVKEINSNINYYITELKRDAINGDTRKFYFNFRFHFKSLFRILEFEFAYMLENYVNKTKYPRLYPEVEMVDHNDIIQRGENTSCKVSVVLLAYNNLEYTRNCVESILENTQDIDYELILVDNGSNDGTKDYFESIPGAKVIHLKHNLHLVKGFNIGLMAAEGKYCAALCNDFIFTPNWLINLITCIESDSTIGFVSPGATNISNMQEISIPFHSIEDFQEKAREYNVSNPRKWEERVVLLPNVLCSPTALLDQIGYYDTRFYRGEFLDDDISFRIRRAGYKLFYCSDTVTHHYGSLTTTIDHETNSLEEGRQTFSQKYGLDAWLDARMNPSYLNIEFENIAGVKTILGIDVKCGATLLQIKNHLWTKYGNKPKLFVCTTEEQYYDDVKTITEEAFLLENLQKLPKELDGSVDLVYIEKPLDCYLDDLDTIFKSISKVMDKNGKMIFMVNNSISIEALFNILNSSNSFHNRKIYIQDMLCLQAERFGFKQYSILNLIPQRNDEINKMVKSLANHLSSFDHTNMNYIESKILCNFSLYQMNYQAVINKY